MKFRNPGNPRPEEGSGKSEQIPAHGYLLFRGVAEVVPQKT
jgi:hypothetical protein